MKFKLALKDSHLLKSLKFIKNYPAKAAQMLLFDVLFAISLYSLYRLFYFLYGQLAIPADSASYLIFILFSMIYYAIIILAYSIFKFLIMEVIAPNQKSAFFVRFRSFYFLNVVLAAIILAISGAFGWILVRVKNEYSAYLFLAFTVPFVAFCYLSTNISHSLFFSGKKAQSSLKSSLSAPFVKTKLCIKLILPFVLLAAILFAAFLAAGYIIKAQTSTDYISYLNAYSILKQVFIIFADSLFYVIIFANRISFYRAFGKME